MSLVTLNLVANYTGRACLLGDGEILWVMHTRRFRMELVLT